MNCNIKGYKPQEEENLSTQKPTEDNLSTQKPTEESSSTQENFDLEPVPQLGFLITEENTESIYDELLSDIINEICTTFFDYESNSVKTTGSTSSLAFSKRKFWRCLECMSHLTICETAKSHFETKKHKKTNYRGIETFLFCDKCEQQAPLLTTRGPNSKELKIKFSECTCSEQEKYLGSKPVF